MKKTIPALLLIILLAGCTLFQPPETPSTEYEIFSNIPIGNSSSIHFFKFTEHGAGELSSLLGAALGGNLLKKLGGGQIGIVSYKDGSSTIVASLKTNLTIDGLLEELSLYTKSTEETKTIGGREVTVVYPTIDRKSPVCIWKEADAFKLVFTLKPTLSPSQCTFPAGFSCVSYSLNENGELTLEIGQGTGKTIIVRGVVCTQNTNSEYFTGGNIYYQPARNVTIPSGAKAFIAQPGTINVVCTDSAGKPISPISSGYSGRIYINYTEADTGLMRIAAGIFSSHFKPAETEATCEKILETKYDYKNVKSLLAESDAIKREVPINGKLVGEYKSYGNSAFGTAFSDDNGLYIVYISKNQSEIPFLTVTVKSNICYSSTGKASILKDGGKEVCMDEVRGIGGSNLILQRGVGDHSILLFVIVKGSKNSALENAKKTIFSVSLPGEEKRWTENGSIEVVVYESGTRTVIPEAKVELYFDNKLQSTKYTDSNGVAKFDNISIPSIKKYRLLVSKQGYINQSDQPAGGISYYSLKLNIYLQKDVTADYGEYSPSTNVTIDEAKLSNIPMISAHGQPLVKIVVGEKGTARDVKAAGNIAAVIGNRAYRKINITASIDTTASPPRCIPHIEQAVLPYSLDTSKTKLVLLDDEVTPQMLNQNLILVGNSNGNKIISDLLKTTSIDLLSDRVVMETIGSNRILVAGYGAADVILAADQFILFILAATNHSPAPTPLTFTDVLLINNGSMNFKIIIGEGSTAEESVGAANIATLMGNLAFRKQSITANIVGSGASTRCEISPAYSALRVSLNPLANKLVVLDEDVDTTSTLILIGPPEVNSVSREVYSISPLPKLTKGNAVVTTVGISRIVIAGGTEMDTERAADKFIEWFTRKYN